MILDCGHEESPHSSITRGYGTSRDGKKSCYACCAKYDLRQMRTDGKIVLYLIKDGTMSKITNWPGSLEFTVWTFKKSRHNWGLPRYDYWFILDGYYWHGYTIGDFTQIAHCRRTKDIYTPTTHCFINPSCLKGEIPC